MEGGIRATVKRKSPEYCAKIDGEEGRIGARMSSSRFRIFPSFNILYRKKSL